MDHLRRLVDHLAWADERVHRALAAAGERAPAQALELFAHVVAAEHVWLARLQQATPSLPVWPSLSLVELAGAARTTHSALRELVSTLTPSELAKEVTYVNSAGHRFTSAVEDIVLHVSLHGAYHRGQVALLLRGSELAPEPTDYIAFVRGAPAATRART